MLLIMAKSKLKPLSFSTTMRNPERIAKFLNCLLPFENKVLTNAIIHEIIKNVIKSEIYQPNYAKRNYSNYYKDEELVLSDVMVEEIIKNSPQNHKEKGFEKGWPSRFDTIFKLAKEFGFIYYSMNEKIIITQTGHMLIDALNEKPENSQKIANIFLNSMMKYQIDNPYRKIKNSNVPLILLLQVINLLKNDPEENNAGVFRKELSLFICWPDNDYQKLYETIKRIRKEKAYSYSDEYIYDICLKLLETDNTVYVKKSKVCGEAIDEYIRKMRITGVISLRGNGRFIDFNEFEKQKIEYILKEYSNYDKYTNEKEFTKYMGEIDSNILEIKNEIKIDLTDLKQQTIIKFAEDKTKDYINKELKLLCSKKASKDPIIRFIPEPARFEFLTSIALVQNFNGITVIPSYPIDDEGLPTSTAGGDIGDIICHEDEFDSDIEVSLMCGRSDQVNNEIVPIRRHLITMKKNNEKSFAIFIAPKIHEDTIQVAWLYKIKENLDILTFDIIAFLDKINGIDKLHYLLEEK